MSPTARVLIIDDHQENLVALRALLERPDRRIVSADSGNAGLAHLLEQDFAVVLLDVQMPEMDGFEVARLMRQAQRTRHVPIIFVTAIDKSARFVARGYDVGAVDYLFKPVDRHILESKVAVFCELYRERALAAERLAQIEQQRAELAERLDEIRTLRGLLPICCSCKKIRDEAGYWHAVDAYVAKRTDAEFTHGLCPTCLERLYPEAPNRSDGD